MEVARVEAIAVEGVEAVESAAAPSRAADLLELTKPRITGLVLITAAVGYAVGTGASFETARFLLFMSGTGLLCAGASALNQYMERDADARMRRTCRRVMPTARSIPSSRVRSKTESASVLTIPNRLTITESASRT